MAKFLSRFRHVQIKYSLIQERNTRVLSSNHNHVLEFSPQYLGVLSMAAAALRHALAIFLMGVSSVNIFSLRILSLQVLILEALCTVLSAQRLREARFQSSCH